MRLNNLKPAHASKRARKRVGRGIGCGLGKTCGRGHKGQKSRSGGGVGQGFEGGQMPLQRRLPKVGFHSRLSGVTAEVSLREFDNISGDIINMEVLRDANIVPQNILRVKIIKSGEINRPVVIQGLRLTKGARAAIETAGGEISD